MDRNFRKGIDVDRTTAIERARCQLNGDNPGTIYLRTEHGGRPGAYVGNVPEGFTILGRHVPITKESVVQA